MPDRQDAELEFPKFGVDVSCAPSAAPAYTAPVAVNVRLQDVFHSRKRGGVRPGLLPVLPPRPAGHTPTQFLGVVVHYTPDALLTVDEQADELNTPGGLVTDTMSNNFPDGPGPTGPGGGPNPPTSPPFPAGFNRRTPTTGRSRPKYGSGVQPRRGFGSPPPPPPPPPPGPVTRTYHPYAEFLGGEFLPVFSVGPFTVPLTPPTDLDPQVTVPGSDSAGAAMLDDLHAWAGTQLPTLDEINALVLSHGGSYGPPGEAGPYQSISDS